MPKPKYLVPSVAVQVIRPLALPRKLTVTALTQPPIFSTAFFLNLTKLASTQPPSFERLVSSLFTPDLKLNLVKAIH